MLYSELTQILDFFIIFAILFMFIIISFAIYQNTKLIIAHYNSQYRHEIANRDPTNGTPNNV